MNITELEIGQTFYTLYDMGIETHTIDEIQKDINGLHIHSKKSGRTYSLDRDLVFFTKDGVIKALEYRYAERLAAQVDKVKNHEKKTQSK